MLAKFYRKVQPDSRGWRRIARLTPEVPQTRDLGRNLLCWLLGCAMVYAALFGIGHICLGQPFQGLGLLVVSVACAAFIRPYLRPLLS